MADYLIRGTAANDFVRAFAVTMRDTAETARERHHLSPVACAALGILISVVGGTPVGSTIVAADIAVFLVCCCIARIKRGLKA